MGADQHRLRRRVSKLRSKPDKKNTSLLNNKPDQKADVNSTRGVEQRSLAAAIERSQAQRARRLADRPQPTYPESLPVVEHRKAILQAIDQHQVVIICGETGSGKTTQLPKLCLELGRGVSGLIGHTQPRRIAARTVAARIASELSSSVGETVGFKIRFSDQVSERSYIKLMTDGILLAEIQKDRFLNQYDTLIIDEAHERSLNIDFLLGYLKSLLPRRPDLKLIITSATIDPERFSQHFNDAPIITAEGRSYPVEVRYQPPEGDGESLDDIDLPSAIVDACEQLLTERHHDVLVFLPGEREIRELTDLFSKQRQRSRALRQVEVLPLFSRLSNAEQNRIFETHSNPRVVLATNVAETSLTVPGIRAVVDTGLARLSRYSVRSKVQRLPIEKISQASANQRAGRCGRLAPGVCVRLYDEEDFLARREFTEPEILRTNLSSVILQMASMRLGDIEDFPFVEPPEARFINDGYRSLQELAALDARRQLTPLGRRLARLPIDPRLGRMLLAAADEGCVNDVLTVVSGLSVQDPRDRPFDKREASDQMHAEFAHEQSDFMAWLNLWAFVTVQRKALSNAQFRKMCRQRFLSPIRLFEWIDVRRQLERLCRDLQLPLSASVDPSDTSTEYDPLHRALLSGLLSNVAVKTERNDYLGTRNRHQHIFPGSALFKKGPKWIMAAEIVETSKLFARQVASVQPEWIERQAEHLLQRTYRDAHWQRKTGTVGAYEQSTLYGLIINPKKRVNYSGINPVESREIFIRDALVAGGLKTSGDFNRHNLALLQEVTDLEEKSRRRDIVVDPETLVRFYDAIIPADVCTAKGFETFRKEYESEHPRGLYFVREMLLLDDAVDVRARDFPDQLDVGGLILPLRYHFAPGEPDDGVTVTCPVEIINRLSADRLEWLVPGMLEEKIASLIKSLPKQLRRNFVPAPDFASAAAEALTPEGSLTRALSRQLLRMTGVEVPERQWQSEGLPVHLLMRIELIDGNGKVVAQGRDVQVLQSDYEDQVEESLLAFSDNSIEQDLISDWNFGDLPAQVDIERNGITMQGYPALEAKADGVGIKLFASEAAAQAAMPLGLRALYRKVLREEVKYLQRKLPGLNVLALRFSPFGSKQVLVADVIDAAIDAVFIDNNDLPRTREAYEQALSAGRGELVGTAGKIAETLAQCFEAHRQVAKRIEGSISLSWIEAVGDVKDQISRLLYAGFVSDTGLERLTRLPVYFRAMDRRLDSIDQAPDKDRRRRAELLPVWEKFKQMPPTREDDARYAERYRTLRWSFEEFRVTLFAQELGAREKMSVSRLEERLQKLRDG